MTDRDVPRPLSLGVVRAELDLECAAQDRRSDSVDTRAGLVLGFAGIIAGVALSTKSLLSLPGLVAAAVAAIYAAQVVRPQTQTTIGLTALRTTYLAAPEDETKLRVLDNRIRDYEFNHEQIKIKVARLKKAIALLTIAVVLVLAVAAYRLTADALGQNT